MEIQWINCGFGGRFAGYDGGTDGRWWKMSPKTRKDDGFTKGKMMRKWMQMCLQECGESDILSKSKQLSLFQVVVGYLHHKISWGFTRMISKPVCSENMRGSKTDQRQLVLEMSALEPSKWCEICNQRETSFPNKKRNNQDMSGTRSPLNPLFSHHCPHKYCHLLAPETHRQGWFPPPSCRGRGAWQAGWWTPCYMRYAAVFIVLPPQKKIHMHVCTQVRTYVRTYVYIYNIYIYIYTDMTCTPQFIIFIKTSTSDLEVSHVSMLLRARGMLWMSISRRQEPRDPVIGVSSALKYAHVG